MKKLNVSGIAHMMLLLIIAAIVLAGSGFAGYRVYQNNKSASAEYVSSRISAGSTHTCAIQNVSSKLSLFCWGDNSSGQIGVGAGSVVFVKPTLVQSMNPGATAVSSGNGFTCGIKSGSLYCWGLNTYGVLGIGDKKSINLPKNVINMFSDVTDVSAGDKHTCAVRKGALYCWGNNDKGQLGDGTTNESLYPKLVTNMSSGVKQVTVKGSTTCAIKSNALFCWGDNTFGEIGDGTTTARSLPKQILGSTVMTVSVGQAGTCAIKQNSDYFFTQNTTLYCWGLTNAVRSSLPKQITGVGSSPDNVSIGSGHICTAGKFSAMVCWGKNDKGQLGDGTNIDRALPKIINSKELGGDITLGSNHTCISGFTVLCTGDNAYGQLGDGTRINRNQLTKVQL